MSDAELGFWCLMASMSITRMIFMVIDSYDRWYAEHYDEDGNER